MGHDVSASSLIDSVAMALKLEGLDMGGDLGQGILNFTSYLGEIGVSPAHT